MNGNNYRAPQACTVQEVSNQIVCTSNVDDMNYLDGDWDSDLVW